MNQLLPGVVVAALVCAVLVSLAFLRQARDFLWTGERDSVAAWLGAGIWCLAVGVATIATALSARRFLHIPFPQGMAVAGWMLTLLGLHLTFAAWRSSVTREPALRFALRFGAAIWTIVIGSYCAIAFFGL